MMVSFSRRAPGLFPRCISARWAAVSAGENHGLICGYVVSNGLSKPCLRHPNEVSVGVGLQIRRLRMRLCAVKHVGNGFALIGREGRYVDQRPNPEMVEASDHSASVGVSYKNDTAVRSFQHAFDSGDVVTQ